MWHRRCVGQAAGRFVTFGACMATSVAYAGSAGRLQNAIDLAVEQHKRGSQTQENIDVLDDTMLDLSVQLREIDKQEASLGRYADQVASLIAAQNEEIASLRRQIERATYMGREVAPLMLRMLDALAAFVELDVPFLVQERRQRVADLRALMKRADVTTSEKFLRVLEAYEIEAAYGRTIEAYDGELAIDGQDRHVEFLRVGRVVHVYRTPDSDVMGAWDKEKRAFVLLDPSYRTPLNKAFRIANKQTAPGLVRLPLPEAEDLR